MLDGVAHLAPAEAPDRVADLIMQHAGDRLNRMTDLLTGRTDARLIRCIPLHMRPYAVRPLRRRPGR